uniref:NADH-ubiquinone oxidoreductase chain 4 n=2 Tax=Sargassum TaxID=3015 RepID=A0A8K1YNX1_9PHAE|nr:NADH dehydrogenase subunit 4 [Sargassum muticum]YP_010381324.1 NADH dehydrogenase subunit 4 [Sargassum kjellmanianum]UVW81858.1 NADH dehydrogenase subunit 4 [Sargassum siliquastrum]AIE46242.1 NADH dehydrogenase subunit 4 [Sargassum muticum]UDH59709.1 NADH dehydrogenase subunit 4 [Sargassum kjellmanianum]UQV81242.1 NADH dehydrogenase subunit 4 [Sargassum muticum]
MLLNSLFLLLIIGVFGLIIIPAEHRLFLRQFSLSITTLVFILSLFLWLGFDHSTSKFQFVVNNLWLPISNINLVLGIDGISLFFLLLTTLIFPLCLLASWTFEKGNLKIYLISFLSMELVLLLVFTSLDLLFFYIFFEAVLIPMFLVIGIYGSRQRKIRAAYMFFLYTLLGSLFMLIGVVYIYLSVGSTNYEILSIIKFSNYNQRWLWLAFFASFASKVPMLPVHIWLPEAHVEAPTAGSVILAGILLKLGSYGFLRFSLGLFPQACIYFTPFVFSLSVLGIVYASLTAIRQTDLKRLIAYTSVAHMNLVMIGLFSGTVIGVEAAILQSLSHGFVSSSLFLIIGVLYDRWHTRGVNYYGGLTHTMPIFIIIFLFFTMANLGLPGTSSFVGEFLLLVSAFDANTTACFFASTSMILGGVYSLWLFNRIAYGNIKLVGCDLNYREFVIFLPLLLGTVFMGLYPNIFFSVMHASVSNLVWVESWL